MAQEQIGIISQRYAKAFFALAVEASLTLKLGEDLSDLGAMFQESQDFRTFIRSQTLLVSQQIRVIQSLGKACTLSDLTIKFLSFLARQKRLMILPHVVKLFAKLDREAKNDLTAQVQTSVALTEQQQAELIKNLKQALGQKYNITLNIMVEPTLLGGMVVEVGSHRIDFSLKAKLQNLQRAMKGI